MHEFNCSCTRISLSNCSSASQRTQSKTRRPDNLSQRVSDLLSHRVRVVLTKLRRCCKHLPLVLIVMRMRDDGDFVYSCRELCVHTISECVVGWKMGEEWVGDMLDMRFVSVRRRRRHVLPSYTAAKSLRIIEIKRMLL